MNIFQKASSLRFNPYLGWILCLLLVVQCQSKQSPENSKAKEPDTQRSVNVPPQDRQMPTSKQPDSTDQITKVTKPDEPKPPTPQPKKVDKRPVITRFNAAKPSRLPALQPIKPPLAGVKIVPEKVMIDPVKPQMVKFKEGMQVEVPANAFVDAQGRVITTPVKLALEVYDTPAKILASGIPMTYNDGKTKGHFESAGMFQLTGTSEGQKVSIAPKKQLKVHYPSKVKGQGFDFFYFEESPQNTPELHSLLLAQAGKSSNWPLLAPPRQGSWKKLTKRTAVPKKEIKRKPSAKKHLTKKHRKGLANFRLKFKGDAFPLLAELENTQWQLATPYKNPQNDQHRWVLNEKWSSLELSQPQIITGDAVVSRQFKNRSSHYYNVFPDDKHWVTVEGTKVLVRSHKGKLVSTIEGVSTKSILGVRLRGNRHLLAEINNKICLYNIEGKQIGCYGEDWYNDLEVSIETKRAAMQKSRYSGLKEKKTVYLMDLSGRKIKSMRLKMPSDDAEKGRFARTTSTGFLLTNEQYFIVYDAAGIKVYDLDGKLLAKKPGKYQWVRYFKGAPIFALDFSGRVLAWDFINDKARFSPKQAFNLNPVENGKDAHSAGGISKIPYLSGFLVRAHRQYLFWNYETDQVWPLKFNSPAIFMDYSLNKERGKIKPEIIAGYNTTENAFYIYNVKTGQELAKLPNYNTNGRDIASPLSKSGKLKRILVNGGTYVQMRDWQGRLVRDFKKYDTTMINVLFTPDDRVCSVNQDGEVYLWDAEGNLLSSKAIAKDQLTSFYVDDDGVRANQSVLRDRKLYDFNGDLKLHMGRSRRLDLTTSNYGIYIDYFRGYSIKFLPEYARPDQVYQLTLRTPIKEFITYVYADDPRLQELIEEYRKFKKEMMTEEVKRKRREKTLMRSFAVNKFGIYNWDKILKREGAMLFAASFDFQQATDYNDIVVFLVTKNQGNAVIPFSANVWDRFAIDPKMPNRLVAVLPNNKLAVFSQAAMDKIDWQKIKKKGKYH